MKNKKDILILGIESSCDDTGVSVVKNGREILSNVISSQIDIHTLYGGVVPEIASRNHLKNIDAVYNQALKEAGVTLDDIDAIAVTYGAGLLGSLIVGVNFAKGLAYASGKPLIDVNHIEGHIAGNYLTYKDLEPPFMCLIVSGGHTALCEMKNYTTRKLVGTTSDDAIGEAFDKVARECGLPYPGGPSVQKEAQKGAAKIKFITKPQNYKDYSFSFSGLKTAVINYIHNKKQKGEQINVADICASFEKEATDIVANKAINACLAKKQKKLVISGGVSANLTLRKTLDKLAQENGIEVYYPELKLCTDNAAMIASAGYYNLVNKKGKASPKTLAPTSTIAL